MRQEVKTINRKDQLSLVVTRHDFKDGNGDLQELHAVKKHFAIEEEGDSDYFFDVSQEAEQQQQPDLLPAVIDSEIQGENHGGTSDLLTALSGVVDIDDDNEPAPENVPTTATTSSVLSNEWGHMGIWLLKPPSASSDNGGQECVGAAVLAGTANPGCVMCVMTQQPKVLKITSSEQLRIRV